MTNVRATTLSTTLLSRLSEHGDTRIYSRNDLVIAEGDVSDTLFVLVTGQVKVFTQDKKGRELVYNVLHPGDIFGELLLDDGLRSASVRALVDTRCVAVNKAQLRIFIETYPEFAEFLINQLIARVRHATDLSKRLALTGVYERTISLLDQVANTEEGIRVVPSTMTQQEIADRIGATREMVNRVLGDLIRGGLLSRDSKRRLLVTGEFPGRW